MHVLFLLITIYMFYCKVKREKGATVHGFTILFMSFKLLFIRLRKDFLLLCGISGKVYKRFKQIQEIISSSSIQSTLSSSKALKFKVTVHNMS